MDFKPQTASKTTFREPSPVISHLLKFAFSSEKRENTLNVSIRFLTDNKPLRKKLNNLRSLLIAFKLIKRYWLQFLEFFVFM